MGTHPEICAGRVAPSVFLHTINACVYSKSDILTHYRHLSNADAIMKVLFLDLNFLAFICF